MRYTMLKYFYHLFILKGGNGAVVKPLFFVYPEDDRVYEFDVENKQFLWGEHLMVTPCLELG